MNGGRILFEEWGRTEWLLLLVNTVAVYIVVRFLQRKIQRKLNEVEARQQHHLHQKRTESEGASKDPAEK
ncbi:MAG: hypothetical protein QF699_04645 [Candidatus Poseidoniaceae archaeon]|nr:hypothetical protein [Candidatus Poseidoniaceae archaeon]MDP6362728.1 hypothetical protein [Candidatus Poseidoniaceae archaeon]